jgi:uncharacterized membrane protein YdjX (TVP38/TMEM64 family)/phosphohistidine phosphatase SixA
MAISPSSDTPETGRAEEEAQQKVRTEEIKLVAQHTSRKALTLLVVGGLLFAMLHFTSLGRQVRDWDTLAAVFRPGGLHAELYFFLISALLIMAGVPRLLFCALGGFAFGFWEGLLCSQLGSLAGSFIAFRAARWGGRDWLSGYFGNKRFFARIVQARPTVVSVALIRMLPVANAVINFGLALGHVGNRVFLLGSFVGFLPQGIIATVVGSGLGQDVPSAGALQIGLAGILLFAILFLASRHRGLAGELSRVSRRFVSFSFSDRFSIMAILRRLRDRDRNWLSSLAILVGLLAVAFSFSFKNASLAGIKLTTPEGRALLQSAWAKGEIVVLVRHSERCDRTTAACDDTPDGITVRGRNLATEVGQEFSQLDGGQADILTSPTTRTKQTATAMFGTSVPTREWLANCKTISLDDISRNKADGRNLVLVTHNRCIRKIGQEAGIAAATDPPYNSLLFIAVGKNGVKPTAAGLVTAESFIADSRAMP